MNWAKHGIDLLQIRGGKGFCPKCHDSRSNKRDRSLSVDRDKGVFNCHHCGFKGTAMERDAPERPRKIYRKPAVKSVPPASKVVKWFAGRGISERTLLTAGITESEEWMPQVNAKRPVICFPYKRDGEVVNYKYRDAEKNFKMEKDAELVFFGLDSVAGQSQVIITEGEIDALSLIEVGVRAAILSVPNGASKGNQRLEYLDNCWQLLEGAEEIIIATDGDAPGMSLRDELARRLGRERCFYVEYPDGLKDFNEVLLKSGPGKVKEVLVNAQPFPLEGIQTANDLRHDVHAIREGGYPDGLRSGWSDFDNLLRFVPGEFTVITGIPGHGKSTWMNNLLMRLSKTHGWRVGLFSPEMQPNHILMTQLVELYSGKSIRQHSAADVDNALNWLDGQFYIMMVDGMDVTIEGILAKAVEMTKYYGINALVIDPWNYVEHKMPRGQSETNYISEALTKIKVFKDRYGVHVFLVAHPTKIKKNELGAFYVPNLYDIAGSHNFKAKMDNGIVVYRDNAKGVTEIHVQKVRHWYLGSVGTSTMHYDPNTRMYNEHSLIEYPL